MKLLILTSFLLGAIALESCAPKTSCGNTKKSVKQKSKKLRSNSNFNM